MKPYFWLIIVWSVVCASGLGIYLYQFFNPIIPLPGEDIGDLTAPLAFWIIAWFLPTVVLVLLSHRKKRM